jgi:hypothetical protein
MLSANYLFYSEENDRIISKIIRFENTLNFQLTPEHLQKKLIRFNLLFNFINPLRPQMLENSPYATTAGLRSTGNELK